MQTAGPEAATSRAIASAADENLGAITYYFGSKDQLISESLAETARRLIEPVVAELTNQQVDPAIRLISAIQLLYRILEQHHDLLSGYLHSVAATSHDDSVKNELVTLHRGLTSILCEEIAVQQRCDSLPDWISPEPMAQLIVALVNGVAMAVAIDPDETDPAAIGTQLALLLLAVRKSAQ